MFKPFTPQILPPKIALVGEAPGVQEEQRGQPFVGASGQELSRMLYDAGIIRNDCYITNVFKERPPNNKVEAWCVNKQEAKSVNVAHEPQIYRGKYLLPPYLASRNQLWEELNTINPNIVVALGGVASWALTGDYAITKNRGTICDSPYINAKVLPTFHPAAVLRQWDFRTIVLADLIKARLESGTKEISRPDCSVWLEPTLEDIEVFIEKYLLNADRISVDIETGYHTGTSTFPQITCIGFYANKAALVIPFIDRRKDNHSYWSTPMQEAVAWLHLRRILQLPAPKVFQNGLYDCQYLWYYGCPVRNYSLDTMVKHHSQQPEMKKDLGFLGSIYTNYPSWKHLRKEGNKKDE